MKIRKDFVTNSSSSSYICCFARVADPEKAQTIIEKYKHSIDVYTAQEALEEMNARRWGKWLECDWAGVDVTPSEKYIQEHMNDMFVVVEQCEELYPDEDGYVDYDVCYSDFYTEPIDNITEENGFTDIECGYGAGRDG